MTDTVLKELLLLHTAVQDQAEVTSKASSDATEQLKLIAKRLERQNHLIDMLGQLVGDERWDAIKSRY